MSRTQTAELSDQLC